MRVPVNPERNVALFDQLIQIGCKRRFERTVRVIRSFRTRTRRMMRHNYNISIGYRNLSRSKFQVQIAQNVQTHSQIRFENSPVFEIKERAEAFASARVVASWHP